MSRTKYLSGAMGLLIALVIGLGLPSAANAQSNRNSNNTTNSHNTTVTGDCRDISNTQIANSENTSDDDIVSLAGVVVGNLTQSGGSTSQSNRTTQSANFNCTNVQQVQAPRGGVKAGAGAAAAPLFGFSGSLASVAYGIYRLRKHVL